MTISIVPDFCRCRRSNRIIVVVMVTAAVIVICLRVVVVVVMAMVAMRRARRQVVRWVKVAEWKFNYFVWLDPAAVVKLKPLQMYYLHHKSKHYSVFPIVKLKPLQVYYLHHKSKYYTVFPIQCIIHSAVL